MTPKSLLRHKRAVSALSEFTGKTSFHRVLWDDCPVAADEKIKRIVLCSGKIYYDLWEEREKNNIRDVVVLRVEQLYPFPFRSLTKELRRFPNAEIVWCQEEPKNQGPWTFVAPRLDELFQTLGRKDQRPRYFGRAEHASTATGLLRKHLDEQAKIVNEATTV